MRLPSRRMFIGLLIMLLGAVLPVQTTKAKTLCFPADKTPYCYSDPFADYWEQNGALPVFGYPITAAASEYNADLGRMFDTQWAERNRLEDHPENAGTPYRILLGRLGAERLRLIGRDPGAGGREGGPKPACLWFEITGHNVCNQSGGLGFKAYWETHGLSVPGLDGYARSLQLFGLPLTEPRSETNSSGDTVLTQWFERARFEWHPTKPDEFKVLLGLLGKEVRGASGGNPTAPATGQPNPSPATPTATSSPTPANTATPRPYPAPATATPTAPPADTLKSHVTKYTLTLPQPLEDRGTSWCTWEYCTLSPRLYHAPLADGRTLVGWTDAAGTGHASKVGAAGGLERTFDYVGQSLHGLVAHGDGSFAVLLWDGSAKIMWLSRRNADGSEVWRANIDGSLTSFNPGIGDSRLTFGNNLYAAYFAVHGDSGWPQGHEGDQLTFVDADGAIQPNGWEWGCSHSLAELIGYHPGLNVFLPVCSSDCFASKGILLNNTQAVYHADGNCGGLASSQLGQIVAAADAWKLVFNAAQRPGFVGKGIGLATIGGDFQSSYVWLTNSAGDQEHDPALARIGADLASDRYLVGWMTRSDGIYRLGVINGEGGLVAGLEEVSSAGIAWGNRDDSFRTRADGGVSWVRGDANSRTLTLFRFDGSAYQP